MSWQRFLTRIEDRSQYAVEAAADVVVAEAYDAVAFAVQPLCANGVILLSLGVAVTVDLHHQAAGVAEEIHHVPANRVPAAELELQLPAAPAPPERALCRSRACAGGGHAQELHVAAGA